MSNEAVIEKPYTLRKLCANDIFPMCSILKQIGFKELKACFSADTVKRIASEGNGSKVDVESLGFSIIMDVVSIIISNMENCKESLYQFLSGLTGMSKKDIGELDMEVFVELIIDVIKKDEFKGFIKVASKFMK